MNYFRLLTLFNISKRNAFGELKVLSLTKYLFSLLRISLIILCHFFISSSNIPNIFSRNCVAKFTNEAGFR